jgi:hypothetical protein
MRIPTPGPRRTAPFSIAILLVAVAGLVAACAGAASAPMPAASPASGGGADGANAGAPGRQDVGGFAPPADEGSNGEAFRDDARIIRTGSLQLEVEDVRAALAAGRTAVTGFGGYIGASQQYNDGEQITATVSYRIPVDRWEDALDAFRGLGTPVAEETNAIEVTDQIVDLDARIRNLRASETALVRHASEAARVSDLLEIEARLSEVRGQIEQLTAQRQNLSDRAAFATLDVTFGTEILAIQVAAEQWDPQTEVDRAGASLLNVLQALTTVGIWFVIVWVPVLAILALVLGIVVFVARRLGFLRRREQPIPPGAAA